MSWPGRSRPHRRHRSMYPTSPSIGTFVFRCPSTAQISRFIVIVPYRVDETDAPPTRDLGQGCSAWLAEPRHTARYRSRHQVHAHAAVRAGSQVEPSIDSAAALYRELGFRVMDRHLWRER